MDLHNRGSCLVLLVVACYLSVCACSRPELVNSSVWYTNQTITNVLFEMAVVTLEFNQPLYVTGNTFLCSSADKDCPRPLNCTPCDWSQQNPTGCEDANCCGPAQWGGSAKEWCTSTVPYETISIGQTSRTYTLNQGEEMHFRFFLPLEYYCHPVFVIARPFYGSPALFLSTHTPTPSTDDRDWQQGGRVKNFGYGYSYVTLCPVIHSAYTPGTYGGTIYATLPTSFQIEIQISKDVYPLPPPPVHVSCSSVPAYVISHFEESGDPVFCLEDGVSQVFTIANVNPSTLFLQLLLPIPSGCHTISLVSNAIDAVFGSDFYCFPVTTGATAVFSNSLNGRVSLQYDQQVVFSQCFEDNVTYVTCGMRVIQVGTFHVIFSTVSEVIRIPMISPYHASLAYQDGLGAATGVAFGSTHFACLDHQVQCTSSVVTPTNDPLFLYPPSSFLSFQNTFEDLQQVQIDAGLAKVREGVLVVGVIIVGNNIQALPNPYIRPNVISLALISVTNAEGETPRLPNNGVDSNPPSEFSVSRYVSHVSLTSIPPLELPPCDSEKYSTYQGIVDDVIARVPDSPTIVTTLYDQYVLQIFAATLTPTSCTDEVASLLDTDVSNITLVDQTFCVYDLATNFIDFIFDKCCNPYLYTTGCCLPFDYSVILDQYNDQSNVTSCGVPDCAASYFDDLSYALNNVNDPLQGCSQGVTDYLHALQVAEAKALVMFTDCLEVVGFGDEFEGIPCVTDENCTQFTGVCGPAKTCALPSLDVMEDQFLACYIGNMTSTLEDYLRRNVLPESVSNVTRDSPEFYSALKSAATLHDCIDPYNPLDISRRTRYSWDATDYYCKAKEAGLKYPRDYDLVQQLYPPGTCLGSFCQFVTPNPISNCFVALEQVTSSIETCPVTPECDSPNDPTCTGYQCVYCPLNSFSCSPAPFTNESSCLSAFACELPDGSVVYDLTEEQCRQTSVGCSSECLGESCQSALSLSGACSLPFLTSQPECLSYGSSQKINVTWFNNDTCIATDATSLDQCGQVSASAIWSDCQGYNVSNCVSGTSDQRYLACYVSMWRPCLNQAECSQSGLCSDREWTVILDTSVYPVGVQFGACFSSGEYISTDIPQCYPPLDRLVSGCWSSTLSYDWCKANPITFPYFVYWNWLSPATSEAECKAVSNGRFGCQLSDPYDILLWILDEEECTCKGGVLQYGWNWTQGVWVSGRPRALEWRKAEEKPLYVFEPRLSLVLLDQWLYNSTELKFLYSLKSEIVCTSNTLTNPTSTLVCDCVNQSADATCYAGGVREVDMGSTQACEGEVTLAKDPSALITFSPHSITSGCTFLNISIIYQGWFSAAFVSPPVSFAWYPTRSYGPVINSAKVTVGVLVGDGVSIDFTETSNIGTFSVCLRPKNLTADGYYNISDFGYTDEDGVFIYPLGIPIANISTLYFSNGNVTFWCANLTFENLHSFHKNVELFPIFRMEDYESATDSYVDTETKALMYTLGVCYAILLFLFACMLVLEYIYPINVKAKGLGFSLPLVLSAHFFALCCFRTVFMFLYPNGYFENDPLSEFIVFEIPTFLHFSCLIAAIYAWKVVTHRDNFFVDKSNRYLAIIGVAFVWSLWIVVTVVYAEVILDNSAGYSPCLGRVPQSYSKQIADTRDLAITYQSVIITITFFLTALYVFFTVRLYQQAKSMSSSKDFVIQVGGSISLSFLVRCILFLIILSVAFISAVYLFITLMITEVIPIAFLFIQFNRRRFKSMKTTISTSISGTGKSSAGTSGTASSN